MPRLSLWPSSRFGLSVANETPLRGCNAVPSLSVLLLSASCSGWVSSSTSDRYGCDLEFRFGDHSCAVILAQDCPSVGIFSDLGTQGPTFGKGEDSPSQCSPSGFAHQIGSATPALCTTKAIASCPLWVLAYHLYQLLQQGPET